MILKKRSAFLKKDEKLALACIAVFHLAGLILLSFSKGQLFQIALDFVPINLILTTLIILKFQQEFNLHFWQFVGFSMVTGLVVEIIGVNSGLIFGSYNYGEVLGPGFLGTPLLIGLNWFLLSYCAMATADYLPVPSWIRYLAAVIALVGFDYLMEPVAIRLGFWSWKNGNIPMQNYAGWAATASAIILFATVYSFKRWNRVAAWAFMIQVLFFLLMNIL